MLLPSRRLSSQLCRRRTHDYGPSGTKRMTCEEFRLLVSRDAFVPFSVVRQHCVAVDDPRSHSKQDVVSVTLAHSLRHHALATSIPRFIHPSPVTHFTSSLGARWQNFSEDPSSDRLRLIVARNSESFGDCVSRLIGRIPNTTWLSSNDARARRSKQPDKICNNS